MALSSDTPSRPPQAGRLGRVVGVPTHSPPPGLSLRAGEELTAVGYDERWPGYVLCGNLEGASGWVPEGRLDYLGPGTAVARSEFPGDVLAAAIGDVLTLHAEANGWYWATREDGRSGWVLAEHVEPLSTS